MSIKNNDIGDKMIIIKGFLGYIKNNFIYLLLIFICLFISFVKLPYDVEMPGGLIDLTDRIKVDEQKVPIKGSYNMTYVSVVQGSIPYILVGLVNKDWDVVKSEENLLPNESIADANKRNKLYLEQSKNFAVVAALNEAGIKYEKKNNKNNVLYIYKEAKTDLEVGDNIISLNNKEINNINDIVEKVETGKIGDILKFKVLRKNKEKDAQAEIVSIDRKNKIGVVSLTTYEIDSPKKIELDSAASESGSSGGLMMSLMVYSGLVGEDLTKGRTIVGTGTIDEEGKVGEIGGIKYKIIGAAKKKVDIFLVPSDNYKEALKVKEEKNYNFELVKIDTLREAIEYLEGEDNGK